MGRLIAAALQLLATAALVFGVEYAHAGPSTINPNVPALNSPLTSLPIQQNFAHAYNDINSLISQNAALTAPMLPVFGQAWINTGVNPNTVNYWDGAAWVTIGTLNTSTHAWTSSFSNATAATFLAGPVSGSAATATFRVIQPSDLPVGSVGAFGVFKPDGTTITASAGILSAVSSGSGTVTSITIGAGLSASVSPCITTCTISLAAPTLSVIGGVKAINAVSHQFLTSIDTSGNPALAQPAFADISGTAGCGQLPTYTGDVTNSGCALTVGDIGGHAVSLGGSLTMSGAFNFTGTLTAATSVTFPTSGTLATIANINSIVVTALPSATTVQLYGGTGVAGIARPIDLGTNLSMSGSTLNATGGGSGVTSITIGSGLTASVTPCISTCTISLTAPVTVALGGTNATSASGTALDNITGFSSTGLLDRTGAGAYSFLAIPLTVANGGTGLGTGTSGGIPCFTATTTVASSSALAASTIVQGGGAGACPTASNTLPNVTFGTTYVETRATPTISAGALTLDLHTGTLFDVALNANVTSLTISNPASSGSVSSFTLILTTSGSFTVTWPASVLWGAAGAPTLSTTSGYQDVFTFITRDGGSHYIVFTAGQAFH